MYRINVINAGEYNNVVTGPRYCLFKKSAIKMIDNFLSCNCDIEVNKFIRIHEDVFMWGFEDTTQDQVFKYYEEKILN